VMCYNDLMAIGILKGLHQAGLHVPQEMSVTGFDNIVYSNFTRPPLSTIDQPKRELGAKAASMMLEQINNGVNSVSDEQIIKRLKGKLLIRQSTAVPKPN
jgi:LacI family transcriptional regulator